MFVLAPEMELELERIAQTTALASSSGLVVEVSSELELTSPLQLDWLVFFTFDDLVPCFVLFYLYYWYLSFKS